MTDRLNYASAGAVRRREPETAAIAGCTCGAATEGKWADKHSPDCPALLAGIAQSHATLIARLAAIKPHPIPTYPEAEDFLLLTAHLREVAVAVDQYILEIGREAKENMRSIFNLKLFTSVLSDAIDGNATYELECAAQEWADEAAEMYDDEGVV